MAQHRRRNRNTPPPTQDQIIIRAFVEEDVALLEDGTLVQVIEVGAVDLDAMDRTQQGWLLGQFEAFLVGLNFPIQVVIANEGQDIAPWIEALATAAQLWEDRLSRADPNGSEREAQERLRDRAWERVDWVRRIHGLVAPQVQRYYLAICSNPLPFHSRRRELTEDLYERARELLSRERAYIVESLHELGLSTRLLAQSDLRAILSHFYKRRVKPLHETPKGALQPLLFISTGDGEGE